MKLIEPCCSQKHWPQLRDSLGQDGTALFRGKGDLSLDELMTVILNGYSEADMILACPALPDHTAELVTRWMRKTWARMDGSGNMNAVARLTLVTDLREQKSPQASRWLAGNPFPDRLVLKNVVQNDTAIVMPDLAIYGALNLVYKASFTAVATKDARLVGDLRHYYESL